MLPFSTPRGEWLTFAATPTAALSLITLRALLAMGAIIIALGRSLLFDNTCCADHTFFRIDPNNTLYAVLDDPTGLGQLAAFV